ncbi:hypothetical protein [Serratia marcescens]|uniref:hypothetical protein n=1 Tax=Serratia marcescens TaxID=615 RepID=UPI0002B86795|nr:hypothetical protein [Serratia marcescens]EMF07018.1 hypothetical protein F518_04553 [Serratia marcescens VGH107]
MKIVTGIIFTSVAAFSGAAYAADAQPTTGNAEVTLEHVHAVMENGSPAQQHDAACKKELSMPESKYMGMKVKTDYTINSSTMMMSAKSMFPSPDSMKPMELTVDLSALGLADIYAFGAFKPVALPQAYIYFTIDKDFKSPVSTFMIINQGKQYNCVISSSNKMMSKEMRGKMMMKKQ